jgi:hypothetical protein
MIGDVLITIEEALKANPEELPPANAWTCRGDLRLKLDQAELAGRLPRCDRACPEGEGAWELRATISLARLLDRAGRRDEARATLAESYGRFTEGFDTPT